MFVGPGRVTARIVNDSVDSVCSDEIPGIDGLAAVRGVAGKTRRIDGIDATSAGGRSAVQLRLVEIDAFFVLRRGPVQNARCAGTGRDAVAGGFRGRRKGAVVSDVTPMVAAEPPLTIDMKPGKESEGFEVVAFR